MIIEKLKNYNYRLDEYYKICNDIIKNYETRKRNYEILQNINDVNNFMKSFNLGISEYNIKHKLNNLLNLIMPKENK
jgi:hypothetical protein